MVVATGWYWMRRLRAAAYFYARGAALACADLKDAARDYAAWIDDNR